MTMFDTLKNSFTRQLPEMTWLAKAAFRFLNPEAREEAAQNALALTWQGYRRLIEQGRAEEPGLLRSVLWFSIRRTRDGRMIQGRVKSRDLLEQRRTGQLSFEVVDLNGFVGERTPIPDHVSFRLDTPRFLATLPERQQRLAEDLSLGMTTKVAAEKYGVTPGAVSHFRVRFKELFQKFMSR
jgi:hypothetical protein